MSVKTPGRLVAAACALALASAALSGCAHQDAGNAAAPAPAASAKMGTDYAQGLAQAHAGQAQAPRAGASYVPNHR